MDLNRYYSPVPSQLPLALGGNGPAVHYGTAYRGFPPRARYGVQGRARSDIRGGLFVTSNY